MSAREPMDQIVNQAMLSIAEPARPHGPARGEPVHLPTWGEDHFRDMLNAYFDFEELQAARAQTGRAAAPHRRGRSPERALRGVHGRRAVRRMPARLGGDPGDVSGGHRPRARRVLGRAVLPEPAHPRSASISASTSSGSSRSTPAPAPASRPRRTRSSIGATRWPATSRWSRSSRSSTPSTGPSRGGQLKDPNFRPIQVSRISLDRELDYRSKMDRRPAFIEELREYGKTKCRWFLKEREAKRPLRRAVTAAANQPPYE